jgi:hypothetical protein
MSLLGSAAELLIPDQTGRRAIEEAVADWRQAQASAGTVGQRVVADAQGAVSLIRVFALVTTTQLGARDVWGPFTWAVVVSAAVGGASTIPNLLSARVSASLSDVAILAILIMPVSVAVFFPIVVASGLGAHRHRATPLAGQVVLAAVLGVMLTGWVVPAANHAFMHRVLLVLNPAGEARVVSGPTASSLQELLADLRSDRPAAASAAAQQLRHRAALALAGPTLLVLGVAVRRRWAPRNSWRGAQVAAGAAPIAAILCALAVASALPASWVSVSEVRYHWVPGATEARLWLTLAAAWTMTGLVLRHKR